MTRLKILIVFLLIGTFSINSFAQEETLMTIGDKEISLGEFERIYNKNNNNITSTHQTPEEYLDLFINFKLKVLEAEHLGMDTTQKFLNEFNGYKDQLATPYLADEESKKQMMEEAYERMKYDLHVKHILLSMNNAATPEDTLDRYNQAMEIRARIVNGDNFEEVAKATSDDPSAKENGGDLGYFTVFMMMYPFESAAYNTPVGGISMPVRTNYGYHILQVVDKREAVGQVRVAHIFIRTPEGMSPEESTLAEEQAFAIRDSINMGIDFGELAKNNSHDRNSAVKDGELPWFGTGRMMKEFEQQAFSLKNPGDISPAFNSFYGWHIVKLLEKKPIGTYSEMESSLQSKAFKGDRERVEKGRYVEKLKVRHNYKLDENAYSNIYSIVDTSLASGNFKAEANNKTYGEKLFTITNNTVTIGEFANYLANNSKRSSKNPSKTPLPKLIDMQLEKFTEELILTAEKKSLPERFPEYKYILQEYHDGILLFDLMDQKVWTNAVQDTTGLEAFFAEHTDEYMWGERIGAYIVSCDSAVDINALKKNAAKIASGKWKVEKLTKKFAKDIEQGITLENTAVEPGKNKHIDAMKNTIGAGDIYNEDGRFEFVITTGIVPPTNKALNETRGQVTSDYQDHLEKLWIKELKEKYKVDVNKDLLSKIEK